VKLALARLLLAVALVSAMGCAVLQRANANFWELERGPSDQAPDPATTPEPVVQVYAARTVGWRGVFAVHTWIAMKPRDALAYTRYEVIGWRVYRGVAAVRVNRSGPDDYWFGARPERLVDLRGDGVDDVIARVESAITAYPYPDSYRIWPGPNSNTFTAWVGRTVPELRLKLPSTAIGKDFLPNGSLADTTPSGTGVQLSLFGVGGLAVGWEEGIELNLLSLNFGVEVKRPALKLPFVGRLSPF
jgi:Protein of unknown function (DUF3750)